MPSYPKFPRSNVPGEIPASLDPGSFGVNWADRKLFVGGPTGVPQLVGFPLRDFRDTSAYRMGDVVVQGGRILRCEVSFLSPGSFNEENWSDLTAGSINNAKELTSSVLLSGGNLTAPGGVVTVAPGSGIQMNVADPDDPIPVLVSWSTLTLNGPFQTNASLVISITGGGLAVATPAAAFFGTLQRTTIKVGLVTTDDLGAVVTVHPAPRAAHQTRDTLTDLLQTLGPIKRSGLQLTTPSTNVVEVQPGEAFWPTVGWDSDTDNPNRFVISAAEALQVRMVSRNGYEVATPSATVDPAQWDNAGVIQAVPAGLYTNQFVLLYPDGGAMVTYGQATHPSRVVAEGAIAEEWATIVLPEVSRGLLMIGCLTTNASGLDQSTSSPNVRAGAPFDGGGSGGGSGDFLPLDGSEPMTGDLDLGGNDLVNGIVDGDLVEIAPRELIATGNAPSPSDTDLSINVVDRKIFYGDEMISQKIEEFSSLRQYVLGDLVIQGTTIYRCTQASVPPGAFDPGDWETVGGGGGSLTGALIKAPTTATRNEVNLTGAGGIAKAISVVFDAGQGADVADFGPRANINRFGVPDKAFGGAVFVVSQATHGFTRVGTPLFYNGLNWLLADDTLQSRFPNVVIAEIIDANNFTVQVAGRISNLNTAAFVGGVITPGTYYYASGTPGLLTSTPGATPVPVLYTTSATEGIVKLTGTVIPATLTVADVVNALYPVGSLYLSVDPTNPGTRYPGTTWVAHAAGRALVGVGTADGTTWAVNDLKGNSSIALTIDQLPAHSHSGSVSVSGSTDTATLTGQSNFRRRTSGTSLIVSATGIMSFNDNVGGSQGITGAGSDETVVGALSINASHGHSVSAFGSFTTANTGSGQAHGNIQPSIGVFVWRRTA